MKLMYLTNIVPEQIDGIEGKNIVVTGGWFHSVVSAISAIEGIDLAIVIPNKNVTSIVSGVQGGLFYYMYPEKNAKRYLKSTEKYLREIVEMFNPDIINVFGTEYPRTLSMVNATDDKKIVITLTGIISKIAEHYYGSMPNKYKKLGWRVLLRPFLNIPTLYEGKKDFQTRGRLEIDAVKKCRYFIGRTRFDEAFINEVNRYAHYYKCNESLRTSFYENSWEYEKCAKHTIMLPQAGYPVKGFEVFIKELSKLKERYPDVKAFVPGPSVFAKDSSIKKKILILASDYDSYLKKEIDRYNLWENLVFTGMLNEQELVNVMKGCNVFVLPSAIENSPNTLGEAMLLGMPCVASCVGGVMDLLTDGVDGFIYPYDEPHIMSHYISKLFDDPNLSCTIGQNAKKRANSTHNITLNIESLIRIYREVLHDN